MQRPLLAAIIIGLTQAYAWAQSSQQVALPQQPSLQKEQELREIRTFEELGKSIEALQTDLGQKKVSVTDLRADQEDVKKLTELLERSEENLNYLLFKGKTQEVPEEYLEDLRQAAEQLQRLRGKERLTNADRTILKEVFADLEVKATSAQQCMTEPFTEYDIKAETKSGNTDAPGLEVWYVDKIDPENPAKYKRLAGGSLSTPVNGGVFAGNYFMWSQDPQNQERKGARKPHTVTCSEGRSVTLPAP